MKTATVKNGTSHDANLFRPEFRELNFDEKMVIRALKEQALQLATFIDSEVGRGREVSIAKQHLEESIMWLTKFVSRDP